MSDDRVSGDELVTLAQRHLNGYGLLQEEKRRLAQGVLDLTAKLAAEQQMQRFVLDALTTDLTQRAEQAESTITAWRQQIAQLAEREASDFRSIKGRPIAAELRGLLAVLDRTGEPTR
jgi:FixJ family two-component response regulator